MKNKKLLIQIKKPLAEVFEFVLNPLNTSEWVDSIASEKTNDWPPKLGTIYENQNKNGQWSKYIISEFKKNKMFVLSEEGSYYHVRYIFTEINQTTTQIKYFEWVNKGSLEKPFTLKPLQKLKKILEKE